ncbi:MAG TPA: hypothetical protein DDY49_10920 [Paenibacillaceae bacterium]|nr:hypothetical protein [Paenibacillaceae bacterium]
MGVKAKKNFLFLVIIFILISLTLLVAPRWMGNSNVVRIENHSYWWDYQYQVNQMTNDTTQWTVKKGSYIKLVSENQDNQYNLQGFKKSVNQIKINQTAFILAIIVTIGIAASAIWLSKVSRPIILSIILLLGGSLLSSVLFYNAYMYSQEGTYHFEMVDQKK